MRLLACLLLIGCTHRAVFSTAADPITIAPDIEGCATDEAGTNYWVGSDGMIGIGQTCSQAFDDWRHTALPIMTVRI